MPSQPISHTGFFEYVKDGVIIRGFTDCNTEEEAEERMLEFWNEYYHQQEMLAAEAKRTDNWDCNAKFARRIKPESPGVINLGMRVNKLGRKPLLRRI